jgi:hypothetical protein
MWVGCLVAVASPSLGVRDFLQRAGGRHRAPLHPNGFHLGQEACGLAMQPQDMYFAVDPFSDRNDRFVDGTAGEG